MRILMFGWELPPHNSGGLGVACFYLARALAKAEAEVLFVLPRAIDAIPADFKILFADSSMRVRVIDSPLVPYVTSQSYSAFLSQSARSRLYGNTLFEEVLRYAKKAKRIAKTEQFDVIHAHDWLSFPAGVHAKVISGKPLVVHVHATEFDRTGGHGVNQFVYEVEKYGMEMADKVITVSQRTRDLVAEKYGIPKEKIEVVYNAVDDFSAPPNQKKISDRPTISFVGRITLQKGPDYFLEAAKKVLKHEPTALFVMAGDGDMYHKMVEKAAHLGIADSVLFPGFVRGDDLAHVYQSTDLFVMPSVSEPFGLSAIEALQYGVPVLISKQTGAGESLSHCLKVDFWDVDEMAAKMLAVLKYRELRQCLSEFGRQEISKFSWDKSAGQCLNIYNNLIYQS